MRYLGVVKGTHTKEIGGSWGAGWREGSTIAWEQFPFGGWFHLEVYGGDDCPRVRIHLTHWAVYLKRVNGVNFVIFITMKKDWKEKSSLGIKSRLWKSFKKKAVLIGRRLAAHCYLNETVKCSGWEAVLGPAHSGSVIILSLTTSVIYPDRH